MGREGRLHEMSAPLIWPPRSPAAKTRSSSPPPRVLKCWAVARCLYLLTTFGFKPSQVRSFLLPLSSSHKLRLLSLFVFSRTKYDRQSNVHRVYNPLFLLRSLAHTAPAAAAAAIGVFDFRLTFTDPLWDWTAKVPGNTKESSKVSLTR